MQHSRNLKQLIQTLLPTDRLNERKRRPKNMGFLPSFLPFLACGGRGLDRASHRTIGPCRSAVVEPTWCSLSLSVVLWPLRIAEPQRSRFRRRRCLKKSPITPNLVFVTRLLIFLWLLHFVKYRENWQIMLSSTIRQ